MATLSVTDATTAGDTPTMAQADAVLKSDATAVVDTSTIHKDIWGGVNKSSDSWTAQPKS